jgi:phytoene dehydrogenase-like protein
VEDPLKKYDAVFIGSGHNALIAAAYLARAGHSVLVLEKNDRPGGLCRTEELTLPGWKHDTYSSAHPLFVSGPAYAELGPELSERGLRYANCDIVTGVSMPDGRTAIFPRDAGAAGAELERLAQGDGAALGGLLHEFGAHAGDIFPLFGMDLSSDAAVATIRKLFLDPSGQGLTSFAADFAGSARDVLEGRFSSPVVHAMFAPWVMHLGRTLDGAGSGAWVPLVLMSLMAGGMALAEGGSEMLPKALVKLLEDRGGKVVCNASVERIVVKNGRAEAVRVAGGEEYDVGGVVVASVNPDQLYLRLLAREDVPAPLVRQAERFRYGRGCVQVQLALASPLQWADERLSKTGQLHLTSGLPAIATSITQALNGYLPSDPPISLDMPTVLDPSRAPEGRAIARLQVLEVPTRVKADAAGTVDVGDGAWTEDLKNRFADRLIDILSRHVPGVRETILARHILSPAEIAAYNPNCGPGDPYGGSHDLAQSYVLRPLPGQPGHQTAVPNVYMLGSATWPGHGVNGGSGFIVAKKLLAAGALERSRARR